MADQGLYIFPQGNGQTIEGKVTSVLFLHDNIWVISIEYLSVQRSWLSF